MKVLLLLFIALLAGCATNVRPAAEGQPLPSVAFQQQGLAPRNGGQLIAPEALAPGDILLSATNGITSAGIRLATLAPVSHAALYIGDGLVAEAVGSGVRVRPLADAMAEESVVVAFRRAELDEAQATALRAFAEAQVGRPYNYVGVVLHAPFSLQRRLCELPLLPEITRDACLRGIATIQLGTPDNQSFFCSQFVLQAYAAAGLPLTEADPAWISPADILHMREGDVPAMRIHQPLTYIGHLKFSPAPQVVDAARR
ncbi:YaeF family permuted papain-like enzyme [Chitinolyticbacter meiyuanensis]|uniref:YaeF family permuted papain-like enzyme n=1 Tax=Chitinolyticbacter meiyuanensis TaxID=682798 RepID=UPI0011E5890C|nr:YaeF family permuted papain-like enzyme [Chitinolyticbacter meiyuanensis]